MPSKLIPPAPVSLCPPVARIDTLTACRSSLCCLSLTCLPTRHQCRFMPCCIAADQLGVANGAEFRAAAAAAEALGTSIVLGDRPLEITLQRAWDALSWRQRLTLCWQLAGASLWEQPAQVRRLLAAWMALSEVQLMRCLIYQ